MKLEMQVFGHTKADIVKALEEALTHYRQNDVVRHDIQVDMTQTIGKARASLIQSGEPIKEYALFVKDTPLTPENEAPGQRFTTLQEAVTNCSASQTVVGVGFEGSYLHIIIQPHVGLTR